MEHWIQSFAESLSQKKHLRVLLPSQPLIAVFHYGKSVCTFIFSKEQIYYMFSDTTGNEAQIEITLPAISFQQVLKHQIRLNTSIQQDAVQVRGSYRLLLLLESLLWLGSSEQ